MATPTTMAPTPRPALRARDDGARGGATGGSERIVRAIDRRSIPSGGARRVSPPAGGGGSCLGAVGVEPGLQDHGGCALVDAPTSLPAARARGAERSLGLNRGEPLILQLDRNLQHGSERRRELCGLARAVASFAG